MSKLYILCPNGAVICLPKRKEAGLPSFEIAAVQRGLVVSVATVGTAKLAVAKFLDAREQYERAWISDDGGKILTFDQLVQRAQEEERHD